MKIPSPLRGVKVLQPQQHYRTRPPSRVPPKYTNEKKTAPWLPSSRSKRRALQRRCQPTPTPREAEVGGEGGGVVVLVLQTKKRKQKKSRHEIPPQCIPLQSPDRSNVIRVPRSITQTHLGRHESMRAHHARHGRLAFRQLPRSTRLSAITTTTTTGEARGTIPRHGRASSSFRPPCCLSHYGVCSKGVLADIEIGEQEPPVCVN